VVNNELESMARKENSINIIANALSEYNLGIRMICKSFDKFGQALKEYYSPESSYFGACVQFRDTINSLKDVFLANTATVDGLAASKSAVIAQFADCRQAAKKFSDDYKTAQHYYTKIGKLDNEKRSKEAKGKCLDDKSLERLSRNDDKLNNAVSTCAESLRILNKHFILVENKTVDFMCPILSSFSRTVNGMNKQTAEASQRLEHIGYQFDELDPQHTPIKNIYSECIQNDYIFQNIKRKGNRGMDGQSISNMMSARQEARSRTPTSRQDRTPVSRTDYGPTSRRDYTHDKKDSSSIMNIFSKIRGKSSNHKHVPLDDVSSFLDGTYLDEFSQNGKDKSINRGYDTTDLKSIHDDRNKSKSVTRKDQKTVQINESYLSKDNWEASYRNDPKRNKQQTERTRIDETRFDPFDKSKISQPGKVSKAHYETAVYEESRVDKSQNYSRSKTPQKPPTSKSIWDSTQNQTYMNETAAMSYIKPTPKKNISTISTKEIGLEEDIDIATQVRLLEEAEKKHKEAQRKKEEETRRAQEYFSQPARPSPQPARTEPQRPNPYADHSRSHVNSTMMTAMNDRSLHRGPPANDQPSIATNNPFGEFLDYNDSDSDDEFADHSIGKSGKSII